MTNMKINEHIENKKEPKGFLAPAFLIIFMVAASFMLFAFLSFNQTSEIMQKNLLDNSSQTIDIAALSILDSADMFEECLSAISRVQSIAKLSNQTDNQAAKETLELLKAYKDTYGEIQTIYIGTADKRMYIYPDTELPSGYDPTGRVWYKNAVNNKGFTWSEPYVDASNGQAIITLSTPIYKEDQLVGVLSADLNLSQMLEKLNGIHMGKTGYTLVTDKNNITLAHPDAAQIGNIIGIPALKELRNEAGAIRYKYDGEEKFAVYAKLDKLNINLIGIMPRSELTYNMAYLQNSMVMFGILFIVFISIIILLVIKRQSYLN